MEAYDGGGAATADCNRMHMTTAPGLLPLQNGAIDSPLGLLVSRAGTDVCTFQETHGS